MEVCSFNWELASKFIPLVTGIITICVAVFVYHVWHKQKGKEVIANEAKEAIKELLELLNIHMKIFLLLCDASAIFVALLVLCGQSIRPE